MKKLLPLKIATNGILAVLSLIIAFHLLVIGGAAPSDIVWGGNIPGKEQLWLMESVSIAANLIMLLFVLAYSGALGVRLSPTAVKVGFWVMFMVFMLNTLGNLLAKSPLETYLFSPLTLLLSLFCFRIAAYSNPNR